MKRKIEKAYLNQLWQLMLNNFDEFVATGQQENIHQFRVSVKKLRAFFVLLDDTLSQNKLSKIFKPVRKIFRHAGEIREAYLNLQMSSRYNMNNEAFILSQVDEMDRSIGTFKESAKKYRKIIDQVHEAIIDELSEIPNNRIQAFYENQLNLIGSTLSKLEFSETLHDCRKRIKTLVYNRKVADKALNGNLNLNAVYLDQLQENIGNWHDTVIAIQLFSTDAFESKPLVVKIKRQNTRLRKSINELSKNFLERATLHSKPDLLQKDLK